MAALEHFYYGQRNGSLRVLGKSAGVSRALVNSTLEHARIAAHPTQAALGWGVLRGERGKPFILAHARQGSDESVLHHYVLLPPAQYRGLGGALRVWLPFINAPVPNFSQATRALKPLPAPAPPAPDADQQTEQLLYLLSRVQNNTRNIQPLLAALVTGSPLVIQNAPEDVQQRTRFVESLLLLLPASTRFGITYLLHDDGSARARAQIRFSPQSSPQATVFDWASGIVGGKIHQNDYSRFLVSQMRLDPALVIQQTDKLARPAGWRYNQDRSLADALDYASRRSRMDEALANNLPVEAAAVAEVLADDPTLSAEQCRQYTQHLLSFARALDDYTQLDRVVGRLLRDPDLDLLLFTHCQEAVRAGKTALVFNSLVRWQDQGADVSKDHWQTLLQQVARSAQDAFEVDSIDQAEATLDRMLGLDDAVRPAVPRLIQNYLPLLDTYPPLLVKLLLVGIRFLEPSSATLRPLLTPPLLLRYDEAIQRLLILLQQPEQGAPPNVLQNAARSLPAPLWDMALLHFAKLAVQSERADVIDENVLAELVRTANLMTTHVDQAALRLVGEGLHAGRLSALKAPAPRHAMQLLLYSGQVEGLPQALRQQLRTVYGLDRQDALIQSLYESFAMSKLPTENMIDALEVLLQSKTRDVPMMAAIGGALRGAHDPRELAGYADQVQGLLRQNRELIERMPGGVLLSLLHFRVQQHDEAGVRNMARLVGIWCAKYAGRRGHALANRAYSLLAKSPYARNWALEPLRQYVREAPERAARHLLRQYSRRLGKPAASRLWLSYEFSNLLGRVDLLSYAFDVEMTVRLLRNAVQAYREQPPDDDQLRGYLEGVRLDLVKQQQVEMGRELQELARILVILGQRHQHQSRDDERYVAALAAGKANPRSIVDVYRAAGGYLTGKAFVPLELDSGNRDAPLGSFPGDDLLDHVRFAVHVLQQASTARPSNRSFWSAAALSNELESRVLALGDEQRDTVRQLGTDWQHLAALLVTIAQNSDPSVIEPENERGQQLAQCHATPANVLELLRYASGFLFTNRLP